MIICKPTIDRLFLYICILLQIQEEKQEFVSSEELGDRLGVTPQTIRKDLTVFGQFGKKGKGYCVGELIWNIEEVLGLHCRRKIAVIGASHLGWALMNYCNFTSMGFDLAAIFDVAQNKIGSSINGIIVSHIDQMEEVIREKNIDIGIITVLEFDAQEVADKLIAAGVRGIWNFAPCQIKVPSTVQIKNENLSVGLSSLSFHLARQTLAGKEVGVL